MYTEKSVGLKSDFYSRYGMTYGELFFEKMGAPCLLFDGGTHFLAFSLDCGVRAYGRKYGDILKVTNSDTNVCDIHFVKNGNGAQILYRMDIADLKIMKDTAVCTVNKLLKRMGNGIRIECGNTFAEMCDEYAPRGWCAAGAYGDIKSLPLPLEDYNVLLVRPGKNKFKGNDDDLLSFQLGERMRIDAVSAALKECKTDVLFEMMNESEKSLESIMMPQEELVCGVEASKKAGGVIATRITDIGIISFCERGRTDAAIRSIRLDFLRRAGYEPRIAVVK